MEGFVDSSILATITGCATIVTLLTQVTKKYLPETIDVKWLALIYSILIGICRIVYIGVFNFSTIVSGIFNIFILLSVAIGEYEVVKSATKKTEKLKEWEDNNDG